MNLGRRLRLLKHGARCVAGQAIHFASGETPRWAQDSLRSAFYLSNGRFNALASLPIQTLHRPRPVQVDDSLLAPRDGPGLARVVADLKRDGYHRFQQLLAPELCDELVALARATPAQPYPGELPLQVYDPERPLAPTYHLPEADLVGHPAVQRVMADPGLLWIAQAYLDCEPVLDLVAMWWSARYAAGPDAKSAQLYHFDMDRLRFVKFFVYLTDVDQGRAPHVFVLGSQREKPAGLLRDGRLSDEELERHYPAERIVQVTGPRGTAFVADTSAFHKGTHPTQADRLMLQLEYANSTFGVDYQRYPGLQARSPLLQELASSHPRAFSRFT